jgi:hypothetical protein
VTVLEALRGAGLAVVAVFNYLTSSTGVFVHFHLIKSSPDATSRIRASRLSRFFFFRTAQATPHANFGQSKVSAECRVQSSVPSALLGCGDAFTFTC